MNNDLESDSFIDIQEASKFLCTRVSWIYQNRRLQRIPCYKLGNKLVFKKKELDLWMKNQNRYVDW